MKFAQQRHLLVLFILVAALISVTEGKLRHSEHWGRSPLVPIMRCARNTHYSRHLGRCVPSRSDNINSPAQLVKPRTYRSMCEF